MTRSRFFRTQPAYSAADMPVLEAPTSPRRRDALLGLACVPLLGGCASLAARAPAPNTRLADRLTALAAGDGEPAQALAGVAACLRFDDGREVFAAAGSAALEEPARPMTADTSVRVASVSKMAVAMTSVRLARAGVIDLDADVSAKLGWRLRHPARPDAPITARALLSHTSGVADPDAYWARAPHTLAEVLADTPHWLPDATVTAGCGPVFTYANLNYGLMAQVLEAASGTRFDRLVREQALSPLGLDAGFNWSGVSAARRREGATLYRRVEGVWTAQMDTLDIRAAAPAFILADEGVDVREALSAYRPGDNGTLFSPQGGLRASARDLARLAQSLDAYPEMTEPAWRADPRGCNGATDGGFFTSVGLGTQIHEADASPWPGVRLVGHPGEAYGLVSGAWRAQSLGVSAAFVITGVPEGPLPPSAHPGFALWELAIMEALADLA